MTQKGYYKLGWIYQLRDEYDLAILNYTKAIETRSLRPLKCINRGQSYMSLRDFDKAIMGFQQSN